MVDDATFSDGEPLTADDVVYTFNRIIKGESIEKTNYGSYVKNMESVKAIDDTTVEFTLSEPTPDHDQTRGSHPSRAHLVRDRCR